MQKVVKRGDMYYTNLPIGVGSEQHGKRPVLIIQNDTGNKYSRTIIAAIITSKIENKAKIPTHCPIKAQQGLERDSLILLEQIRTFDKSRLREYIGTLDNKTMSEIDEALAISIGLEKRQSRKGEMLELTLCPHCERDFRNSGHLLVKKGWQEIKWDCDFCKVAKGLTFNILNLNGRE